MSSSVIIYMKMFTFNNLKSNCGTLAAPLVNVIKISVVAVMKNLRPVIAGIARNSSGKFLSAFSYPMFPISVMMAEVLSIHLAMDFSILNGYSDIVIETSSHSIANCCNLSVDSCAAIFHWMDCLRLRLAALKALVSWAPPTALLTVRQLAAENIGSTISFEEIFVKIKGLLLLEEDD